MGTGDFLPDPKGTWCFYTKPNGVTHLYPMDDLINHEFKMGCACGPREEDVKREGILVHVLVHPSLDGREVNK